MTFQPWIQDPFTLDGNKMIVLQWSHDLSAMDTILSSGPSSRPPRSFNGAMTFQPWIRFCRLGATLADPITHPSMEP